MITPRRQVVACVAGLLLFQAGEARAYEEGESQTYYTLEDALKRVFPDAEQISRQEVSPTPDQRKRIEAALEGPLEEKVFSIYVGQKAGSTVGYGIVTEEIGRFHPITFLVRVDPDGRVADTLVMVYRESRGGEVRHKRFLNQFKGKRAADPVQLNHDIVNVTGATLSVRAIARGVKKVLAVVQTCCLKR